MKKQLLLSAFVVFGFTLFATNHTVTVNNFNFSPNTLTINIGDSVTWSNSSGTHNVNGTTGTFANNPSSFGNGTAASNWTFTKVFTVSGSYSYRCDPHYTSGMTGSITVNAAATGCSDLFFSEYIEGGGNNKAIEVYNPTNASISLTGYTVSLFSNGATSATSSLALSGSVAAGDVYIICANQANATILAQADTAMAYPSPVHFNGNDAVILLNSNNDTIDAIGIVGVNPGTSWTVGTGSTKDYTLVRKITIDKGTKDWTVGATEWDVYPKDTTMYLGAHVSNCITGSAMPCAELFFSEYIEGGSNNKAIEIYNPSGNSINLSGYTVSMFSNGSSTVTSSLALYGTLASGDVFVYSADQANAAILAQADTALSYLSPAHFNGNDAVILLNSNNDTIDAIGVVGVNPGASWTVGTGSTKDYTLVRKSNIDKGTKDWTVGATEWDVYPKDTTMYLGSHTSNCMSTPPPSGPIYSIADITTVDAMGVTDSLGVTCAIIGYVSGDNLRSSGVEAWLIDTINSAGLMMRNTSFSGYTTASGDKLWVRGTVGQFAGLTQFNPDSIVILSSGNTLPTPLVTTVLDEAKEGRLLEMKNMTYVSGWPSSAGSSANVTISDGTNSFTMRIDGDTDVADSIPSAPTGTFDVIGHGGQFDFSSPFTSGYQILPRFYTDIVMVAVTSPTINFNQGSQLVSEGAGTVPVHMLIAPQATTAETVKVYVMNGGGVTSGDYTTTPAAVLDTITVSVPANADSVLFNVNIIDDALIEPNDTIYFSIATTTSGLSIGGVDNHNFIIADNDIIIPAYTIGQVDGLDADFVLDSLGTYCKLEGVVMGVDLQGTSSTNVQFTFHDGTDGFGVFASSVTNYTVTEGDRIRIIGTVSQFSGLAQINPDSIAVISTGNTLQAPTVVTALGEMTESDLIRINGVTILDPTQWTNSGSGFNVDISNGTDTFSMRIDNEVDLYTMVAPAGTFDVVGIGSQFDFSSPYSSGYQFLPRYSADIIYPAPFTYDLHVSEIMPGSVDPNSATSGDWFEIINYGSTSIDLNGFSFDDDSETPGTQVFGNVTIASGEVIVVWNGNTADKAAFLGAWRATTGNPQIISKDDLTGGSFPNLGQGGDMVVLYDTTAGVPIEICKAQYASAAAGLSKEFDTTCLVTGNATNGTNGAYMSNNGDVGSPGNVSPDIGVKENELTGVKVYPNPAKDVLFIEFADGAEPTTIEMTNLVGQTIFSAQFNDNRFNLDVSHLPKGMYLVKFTRGNKAAVKNIIVQ